MDLYKFFKDMTTGNHWAKITCLYVTCTFVKAKQSPESQTPISYTTLSLSTFHLIKTFIYIIHSKMLTESYWQSGHICLMTVKNGHFTASTVYTRNKMDYSSREIGKEIGLQKEGVGSNSKPG